MYIILCVCRTWITVYRQIKKEKKIKCIEIRSVPSSVAYTNIADNDHTSPTYPVALT